MEHGATTDLSPCDGKTVDGPDRISRTDKKTKLVLPRGQEPETLVVPVWVAISSHPSTSHAVSKESSKKAAVHAES
jgi:hypothetical protein